LQKKSVRLKTRLQFNQTASSTRSGILQELHLFFDHFGACHDNFDFGDMRIFNTPAVSSSTLSSVPLLGDKNFTTRVPREQSSGTSECD
jgi:hypothetical protein